MGNLHLSKFILFLNLLERTQIDIVYLFLFILFGILKIFFFLKHIYDSLTLFFFTRPVTGCRSRSYLIKRSYVVVTYAPFQFLKSSLVFFFFFFQPGPSIVLPLYWHTRQSSMLKQIIECTVRDTQKILVFFRKRAREFGQIKYKCYQHLQGSHLSDSMAKLSGDFVKGAHLIIIIYINRILSNRVAVVQW